MRKVPSMWRRIKSASFISTSSSCESGTSSSSGLEVQLNKKSTERKVKLRSFIAVKVIVLPKFYSIFDLMDVSIESSWKNCLQNEFSQVYFERLRSFVREEYAKHPGAIFPKGPQIFRAFDACPFDREIGRA